MNANFDEENRNDSYRNISVTRVLVILSSHISDAIIKPYGLIFNVNNMLIQIAISNTPR